MPSLTPRSSSGVHLRPLQLAELLDQWALRREKVLTIIDIAGAQHARELAHRCRALVVDPDEDDPLLDADGMGPIALEWLEIREAVVRLMQRDVAQGGMRSVPPSR